MADNYITEGMMDMFLFESSQMLEQLESIALDCEKNQELKSDDVNEIFRIMHTIKGSSGIMMYTEITTCAHTLEDVFYYIRESKPENIPISTLVEIMLEVSDFIKNELEKIREGGTADGSSKAIVERINLFLDRLKHQIVNSGAELPPKNAYQEPERFYISPVATADSKFYLITIYYRSDTEMVNIRAYNAVYSLKEVAEDIKFEPEEIITDEKTSEVILQNGFQIALQAQSSEEEILRLIDHIAGVSNIEITPCSPEEFLTMGKQADKEAIVIDLTAPLPEAPVVRKKKKKKETEAETAPETTVEVVEKPQENILERLNAVDAPPAVNTDPKAAQEKQSFISVNVKKMDELMDLIGELVIAEAVVIQNPDLKVEGLELASFHKAAGQLSKITSELQDIVMGMRMMPLRNTFMKMNRIVHDISRKLGKEIELKIVGEDTEVDKNIIEHISDPLMHLVRNAVDHGIETVEERKKAGKEKRGTILLEAKNEGGKVWITVRDDGAGMSRERILAKAREQGLLGSKNEKELSDREVYGFITYPGFSTNESITEYSGRGVGMDVVVQNIQKIGGSLEIESKPGEGSTMTIKIPLTLAIIDGIIVGVGENSYVFGTGDVQEFVRINESQVVKEPEGMESIMLRGDCYPVIRLKEFFRLSDGHDDLSNGVMTIMEHEGKRSAVFVDSLIGEQEIVVKPVPSYIKKTRGISGCTQLGDGSISLIIDTASLIG